MNRSALIAFTLSYLAAACAANWLTSHYGQADVGFGMQVTAGTFAAGFALLARDFMHRSAVTLLGRRTGIWFVLGVILTAGGLSWVTAAATTDAAHLPPGVTAGTIVLASTVAFLIGEAVDLSVFTPLRGRAGFIPAALVSNIVSAPVDTVVFLQLAGFSLTASAVTGQFIAKVLYATLIPLTLWALASRGRDLQPS